MAAKTPLNPSNSPDLPNDPVHRALSARIKMIGIHIRKGDLGGALALCDQLESVLPWPERINFNAAKDCAKRGRS